MVTRNPLALSAPGRWLALDVGDVRVGLALSNHDRTVALVRGTCPRTWQQLREALQSMLAEQPIVAMVVGYPLNMDGSAGPRAQAAHDVAVLIEKELGLPVLLWDERLTSRAAEAAFFEQRQGRGQQGSKKRSVGRVDAAAAVLILEAAMAAARVGAS